MKDTLVLKFGGTSVGSARAIRQIIEIARKAKAEWRNVAIVVSAMSGVTDALLNGAAAAVAGDELIAEKTAAELLKKHFDVLDELAPQAEEVRDFIESSLNEFVTLAHAIRVLGEASPRALDAIASLGERMSAPVVSAALRHAGIGSESVDAREVVLTDSIFQSAAPDLDTTTRNAQRIIWPLFQVGRVPVITGFIGANEQGVVTTLGRGGSDFSGAIFGVVLDSDEVWIYTDVTGVMTTDPRIDPRARTIPELSFREISELAFYGAKVLHPKSIRPVVEKGITLWVKNTFIPEEPGTRIVADGLAQLGSLRAVTAFKGQSIITVEGRGMIGIPGIAARTFGAVAREHTSIVMISQASSEQSICFVVPSNTADTVVKALEHEFRLELNRRDIDSIQKSAETAIITIVGAGMRSTPGLAGKILTATGNSNVNVIAIAQGSSECSVSLVVDAADAQKAVLAIHELIVGNSGLKV
ncbi:MAG: aspartate kinase [Chloroflexi bacterium HGW-Chloroflexi-6]|nr:MAG: aspartate kinase [Chloroflexi bacterium HGW-Chloroflexi-6]